MHTKRRIFIILPNKLRKKKVYWTGTSQHRRCSERLHWSFNDTVTDMTAMVRIQLWQRPWKRNLRTYMGESLCIRLAVCIKVPCSVKTYADTTQTTCHAMVD